jgi:hypothetical protein
MKAETMKSTRQRGRRLASRAETPVSRRQYVPPGVLSLKTIIVPIDFSPPSMTALKYATRLAKEFGSTLRLVHVVEPAPFLNDLPNVALVRTDQEIAEAARIHGTGARVAGQHRRTRGAPRALPRAGCAPAEEGLVMKTRALQLRRRALGGWHTRVGDQSPPEDPHSQ